MFVLKGPLKVEGVMFGNNIVKNGRIHQEIKWNVPVLRYNAKPQYVVRYANSLRDLFNSKSVQSSVANSTLRLTFSTTNITYYVVVAVRSAGMQRRGDYSYPVSITYTSEFVCRLAELNTTLYCTDALARWGSNYFLYRMHCGAYAYIFKIIYYVLALLLKHTAPRFVHSHSLPYPSTCPSLQLLVHLITSHLSTKPVRASHSSGPHLMTQEGWTSQAMTYCTMEHQWPPSQGQCTLWKD